MPETRRVKAQAATITDECRKLSTPSGDAFDRACAVLRSQYNYLTNHWPIGHNVEIDIEMHITYPTKPSEKQEEPDGTAS